MADFSITGEVRLNSDPAEKSTSKWTVAAGQMIADFAKQASSKLAEVVKSGVDYNATMESYLTNFKVMLGSEEAAATKLSEIRKMAASTPFSLDDLTGGTQTLLQFGIVTSGLFQLGELSVTGLDTLTELLDLGFQLCDLGSLCVEVGAGHKALADLLRNCRVNFGGVRIPQYGFQPFQHDCYLLACLLSFLSGQSRCCSAHLVVRWASGIWV